MSLLDNRFCITHRKSRTSDPDDGSLTWNIVFENNQILIKYTKTDWGSGYPSCDYIDTYKMIIENGVIVNPTHKDKSYSDYGDSHNWSNPISNEEQIYFLNNLKDLITKATPLAEEAIAEYEIKSKVAPILHSFFSEAKYESGMGMEKGVVDMMINYLA